MPRISPAAVRRLLAIGVFALSFSVAGFSVGNRLQLGYVGA